jgi:hypothetical protein
VPLRKKKMIKKWKRKRKMKTRTARYQRSLIHRAAMVALHISTMGLPDGYAQTSSIRRAALVVCRLVMRPGSMMRTKMPDG